MTSLETGIEQKDYLYAVLDLPNTAPQNEIRERYRALSVIFHPDKQHDERVKDTASTKFLEIQKAYEGESPRRSHAYKDTTPLLCVAFLTPNLCGKQFCQILFFGKSTITWVSPNRNHPSDADIHTLVYFLDAQVQKNAQQKGNQIKAVLNQWKIDHGQEILQELLKPRGSVTCAVNASSLFASGDVLKSDSRTVLDRVRGVEVSSFGVRHSIMKDLGPKTTIGLIGHAQPGSRDYISSKGTLTGTLRHQFSPRFVLELTAAFLRPHIVTAKTTYSDNENAVSLQTNFIPALWYLFPPLTTLSFGRRLFRDSLTQGSAAWTYTPASPAGRLELSVFTPKPFDLTSPEDFVHTGDRANYYSNNRPGSTTGFAAGVQTWSYGLVLSGIDSCITTEFSVSFVELALRLKASVEVGLRGAAYFLSAKWSGEKSAFSTGVGVGNKGVMLRFELSYLQQKWMLPITLSPDNDQSLALYTVVLPSTALALGYHFILKPRRRTQRAKYFDNARRTLNDEKSELKREIETTTLLLQDPARRHMDAERAKGGLVILEAIYGPAWPDKETAGLDVDVTIPLQALVHNSQVYVSGKLPKSGIRGFYDPAPASPKSLRVRYTFRDRMHFAEIPDLVPIVLPLRDHLVM
ncbi:hypothetical protein HYDPIDRAFT_31300 [Hydnomerulius pinastri MD-312]|uniref:J domain-containing protein n=1 Tax=Hydnomerulius pinastri MD-312 TaxID=994086 RepID=A0A0C9V710_9AGAM|nr:hypothetical protein HYDPIDRAFT_31300 [Hydnomerulius pinastri MD-312]